MTPPARPAHSPWLIFVAVLACYHANGRPQGGVDTVAAPYAAWALVRHGSWDLQQYKHLDRYRPDHIVTQPDGRWMTTRPGAALAALPVVLPFALGRETPLSETNMYHLGKLASGLHVAAAAAVFYLLLWRLVPAQALLATVLFALGTSLYSSAGMALWMHGPATFWLVVALYLLVVPSESPTIRGFWAGLALGLAFFARPTVALFLLATMASLLVQGRLRKLAGVALGLVLPVMGHVAYSHFYMGHAMLGGYGRDAWGQGSFAVALAGLLVSPSRGLFVYTPAFLLVPVGAYSLWRNRELLSDQRSMALFWLLAVAATAAFYAACWPCWWAGWSYGPRFFCECVPALGLAFAFAAEKLSGWAGASLTRGLVGLSVLVHAAGVFGSTSGWHERHEGRDPNVYIFELRDSQIEASLRQMLTQRKATIR